MPATNDRRPKANIGINYNRDRNGVVSLSSDASRSIYPTMSGRDGRLIAHKRE